MIHATMIYNARLLDENIEGAGAILLVEGKIRGVFQGYFTSQSTARCIADAVFQEDGYGDGVKLECYNAKGLTVTPAFIDMHVHLRDPGLTQKEDLCSGLKACVRGGYGTVVAMPNTMPVISSLEAALENDRKGYEIGAANLIQSVSITNNFEGKDTSHIDELNSLQVPLITEDGHDVEDTSIMLEGMQKAGAKDIIVSCHCEDCTLARLAKPHREKALELMKQYGLSAWGGKTENCEIPEEILEEIDDELSEANGLLELAENTSTERNIEIAKAAGCHIHIAHVSTIGAIQSIRNAKKEIRELLKDFYSDMADCAYDFWLNNERFSPIPYEKNGFSVSCEVTPHHIALCGTEEPNIRALVNPPLRSEDDRLVLIEALRDGTVDCIATDHAPHTLEDKAKGSPGFTGIETAFGVCNTVLVRNGQISAKRLSQLMSANPARLLKLNKGLLKAGYDADITIFDPDEKWTVDSSLFVSKGKATPFEGYDLYGKVKSVFISGRLILEE